MRESQIHDQFVAWLRKLEIPYIRHRMDRKSGIQSGWPDFTVLWMSRAMCIEIKTAKGRVTIAQQRVIDFIRRSGNRVEICRSCEECIEAVKNILCEGKLGDDAMALKERPRFKEQFTELKRAVAEVPGNGTKNLSGGGKQPCKHGSGAAEDGLNRAIVQTNNANLPAQNSFYIIDWKGAPYVVAPDQYGAFRMIRKASAVDVANLSKLPSGIET